MTDFLKSAKKARAAGDLQGAGDFLLMAGRPEEAVSAFIEGGLYARAGEALESAGDLRGAAEMFVKADDVRRGAALFERVGELSRAADLYEQAGELYRAAQISERGGQLLVAAERYQRVGHLEKAAQLFYDGGDHARSGELYEELWLSRDREDPRHGVRSLLSPERIADLGGRAFFKAEQFERAGTFFTRAGLHDRAADAYVQAGDSEKAARSFRKAGKHAAAIAILEHAAGGPQEKQLLAEICLEVGQPARAGALFEDLGRVQQAAECFEKAGESTRAATLFALMGDKRRAGDLFQSAGDLKSAARAYEAAGMLEPALAAYEDTGETAKAAELASSLYQALKAKPQAGGRARVLAIGKRAGDLLLAVGQAGAAAAVYEEIGLARDAARAYEQAGDLGKAAEQTARVEDYEAAIALYRRAAMAVPLYVEAGFLEARERYAEAALLFEKNGDQVRAAALYERAGQPAQAGRMFEVMGDFAHAAECYEAGGEPRKAGQLFQKAGLLDRAAECLERAGDLERAAYVHLLAENFMAAARSFIRAGKPDDAVVLLQKIKPGHPDYALGCLCLGDIFFEKGLHSLAMDKYYKGLQDRPADESLLPSYYNLALTYESLERFAEARECYEKILSVDYGYKDARARREGTFAAEQRLRQESAPSPSPADTVIVARTEGASARFEVKGVLESDELGVYYRAWDRTHERPVNLRRFTAPGADPAKLDRLLREARTSAKLQHANVLATLETGDEDGVKFVCTEYVEATSLRARLDAGEKFDPYRAAEVGAQIAMALDHAHRAGVLHRNLRPETVLLLTSGDIVKVRDFGFADRLTDTLKATGEKRHPLLYMAPEQILGRKIDERSDYYSLGVVLYELLFGQPPFTGEDIIYQHVSRPVTFPKGAIVPERLRRLVARCLEKDPARRYQRAREIVDELRRAEVEPGTLIEGRYEIQAEIGSGGMGKVYRAFDRELDEAVALKILKAEFGENSEALSRFLREIKLSRKIAHPNVVKVYDMGRFRGSRFISMEFIQGPSLEQWIRERKKIEIEPVLRFVRPVLSALQAAHELGIVHRDIKPANVLLAGGTVPKIVDFGIARGANSEGVTLSGEVLGSPKYMSPEHIEEGVLDRRADLYAVGVLMYYLLTGREPFTGENPTAILLKHIHEAPKRPRALNPEVPDWLEAVVLKCLAKDPARRYQWAAEIVADLDKAGAR